MSRGMTEMRLGDVASVKHGFAFEGRYFVDDPRTDVLVTPGNFAVGGGFKQEKLKYYDGPVPEEYVLTEDEVIITMTDLSKTGDTLGYAAFVPKRESRRFLHNQRIGRLMVTRPDLVDKDFLCWLLRTPSYRDEVLAGATGTTVKHTSPKRIEAFRFAAPPLPAQRAIARTLQALDDKIALNRRTNERLEAMARALFKSWFVDFDPVHAKREGRKPHGMDATTAALFPATFEDSALGPLPSEWTAGPVTALQSSAKYACVAGPFGSNLTSKDYVPSGVPVIRGGNLSSGALWLKEDSFAFVSEEKADQLLGNLAFPGDVVFTQRGTLGQVAIVPCDTRHKRFVISQSQMKLTVDDERGSSAFVALYFQQPKVIDLILANGQQAGVPHVNLGFLRKFAIVLPPSSVLRAFDRFADLWLRRALGVRRESQSLTALRDALLPKLLSGEIRVPEAERIVGKAV